MEKNIYPKYRWYVGIVMLLAVAINAGLVLIAPAPLVGIISEATGWALGTVTGIIMGAFILFVAAGCVISGFLLDRIGIPKVFIMACALTIIGSLLMPVLGTMSIGGLIFVRLLEGLGAGFVLGANACIASKWFPSEERGIVTGLNGAANGLGVTLGLLLSPAICNAVGNWAETMAICGSISALPLVLSIIMNFGPKPPQHVVPESTASNTTSSEVSFSLVLKEPMFYLMIVMSFLFSYVNQGFNDLAPGYLAVDSPTGLGFGSQTAGNIFSSYSMAFMIGALLSGFVGRYILKNRLKIGMAIGFVVAAVCNASIMFPAVHSHRGILVLMLILSGFFYGWCMPMMFAYITQSYPASLLGRIGGLTQGLGTVGATVGVAVGSFALNITGRYIVAITVVVILLLLDFVLTFFLYKPKRFKDMVD